MITEGELKSKLKFLVIDHDPEMIISNSDWNRVYHFFVGYSQCFKDAFRFPIEDSYAKSFILNETFQYLLKIAYANN